MSKGQIIIQFPLVSDGEACSNFKLEFDVPHSGRLSTQDAYFVAYKAMHELLFKQAYRSEYDDKNKPYYTNGLPIDLGGS